MPNFGPYFRPYFPFVGSGGRGALGSEDASLEVAVRQANAALNAYFALAAWPRAVKQGIVGNFDQKNSGTLNLPSVLQSDSGMQKLALSLAHMPEVSDTEVKAIAIGLPPNLVDLHLSFEACHNISDAGLSSLAHRLPRGLQKIHLDFLGCEHITDMGLRELASELPQGLLEMRLDFAKCHKIGSGGVQALAEKLPPQLKKCSATFQGTKYGRNFGNVKDFRAAAH